MICPIGIVQSSQVKSYLMPGRYVAWTRRKLGDFNSPGLTDAVCVWKMQHSGPSDPEKASGGRLKYFGPSSSDAVRDRRIRCRHDIGLQPQLHAGRSAREPEGEPKIYFFNIRLQIRLENKYIWVHDALLPLLAWTHVLD